MSYHKDKNKGIKPTTHKTSKVIDQRSGALMPLKDAHINYQGTVTDKQGFDPTPPDQYPIPKAPETKVPYMRIPGDLKLASNNLAAITYTPTPVATPQTWDTLDVGNWEDWDTPWGQENI